MNKSVQSVMLLLNLGVYRHLDNIVLATNTISMASQCSYPLWHGAPQWRCGNRPACATKQYRISIEYKFTIEYFARTDYRFNVSLQHMYDRAFWDYFSYFSNILIQLLDQFFSYVTSKSEVRDLYDCGVICVQSGAFMHRAITRVTPGQY